MIELGSKKALLISNVVMTLTTTNFAMFCNPANRGKNFRWSEWQNDVVEHVQSHLFIYIPLKHLKDEEEIRAFAETATRHTVSRLLELSGFRDERYNHSHEMENSRLRLALEKIASVNACDYEYRSWAKEALNGPSGE